MINKAILIGNLGADPELRQTGSGTAVCEFRIATSERWKDRDGQQQERTEWHRIIVWGRQGENCARFLSKGRKVYVEGRIQTRKWQGQDGSDRYTTEIVANTVQFLGNGSGGGGDYDSPPPPSDYDAPAPAQSSGSFSDDEIPF